MDLHDSDSSFTGSVPELYDRLLVPLIFESYADDLVRRVHALDPDSVLEVAAGSGALSRAMAKGLGRSVSLVCTDLNEPMIDHAKSVGTARPVSWKQADVDDLPFGDDSFDVVVCQFGVMFFPDVVAAFAEIARVLRGGGVFLFNVWDEIAANDFAAIVTHSLTALFPDDPPLFLDRVPHGYYDERAISADLVAAGFDVAAGFEVVTARSRAGSSTVAAVAYCQGTPLRNEIEARDWSRLQEATDASAEAIAERFADGRTDVAVDGQIRGFVVTAVGNRSDLGELRSPP